MEYVSGELFLGHKKIGCIVYKNRHSDEIAYARIMRIGLGEPNVNKFSPPITTEKECKKWLLNEGEQLVNEMRELIN